MRTKPAYLVIDTQNARGPTIARVTQRWPQLYPGEIVVRVAVTIPGPPYLNVIEFELDAAATVVEAIETVEPDIPEEDN